ncbi:DarB-like antirestriction [Klebsiella phage LASTA]|uniref:PLxRFG domain-containing protein n=2 Tax=Lastavirus lasta TaxID=2845090 RepID=A0A6H0X3A3_9CAUD|nr:DarB-like antirestriction [Klebsiella phage LASTA]QIW86628.1 PLxRFG domain-containing protein [Klebsiella phage LASTA]QIW86704.1 PLxRFG domain-containing protein [Klebsiella phage SJM3]
MAKNSLPSELDLVQQPSYGLPDWAQRPQAQTVNTGGAVPFQAEFLSASQKYGVPFNVLMGLAEQESSFNPTAIGVPTKYGRAKGLMQYIDSTASSMGINPYDPVQSIDAAARQLRERLDKGYSMQEAVQAHFGGDDRKQWGPKTAQYGKDVLGRAEKFLGGGQSVAAGQPTQQQDQPQTRMEQIAQDYPPAQSAMENLDQTRQRTQALLDEMNKEEPGRYRPLTDEEMQRLSQHITPEMQQQAMQSGKPIEINIPDLVQPGQAVTAQQSQQQPEKRQAELKPWEPTLWERIKGLIPGNKDAATVEMIARDIANREGVSVEEVYKSMGSARPMWNPEGRAPIQALAEGAGIVGKQLPNVPSAVANATLRAVRGGDISADGSTMMDRAVSATNVPQEENPDPNYQSVSGIDQSLGFSVSNMLPSIGAGALGNMVSPGVGTGAGFATSAAIAYRASKDQFLDDVKKKAETEKGSKLTEKEWDTLKDTSEAAAMKYGAWEAIPEALSNAIALKMISHPLVGATRAARIADAAKRLGKEQIAEQVTETATTLGQNEAERDVGLSNEKMSVADAFRQQAIQTALVSGIQGGTMQAGRAIYDRVRGNREAPTEERPTTEPSAQTEEAATEPVQEAQPEPAVTPTAEQPQEAQPSGPLGRAVQNGTQQVVNDVAAQAEQNTAAAENHTPDEFMGPVGSETTVHPADDPSDSFPAVVQGYRDGNAIVVDENGEILEFGPHEVVRPDAAADVMQQQPAQEVTEPVQQTEKATEEQPHQPKAVSEMTEPELRDRLKYLHQQAKSSGGWNERLTKARREVEKAIDAKNVPVQGEIDTEAVQANGLTPSENRRLKELLNKDSRTQAESAEATRLNEKSRASLTEEVPQSTSENTVGAEGMTLVHGSGNGNLTLDDIQIVRANGQKQGKKGRVYGGFYGTSEKDSAQAEGYAGMMEGTPTVYDVKIKPGTKVFQKEGDITRLSENTINDLVSKGYGVVVGTDPRGRTEYAVIDKDAIQGISQRGKTQEQVASNEEQNPTLNKDGSQKWFGTERKANEYLQKKGITGTHEIRLVDRRFEIHPKAEATSEAIAPKITKKAQQSTNIIGEPGDVVRAVSSGGETQTGQMLRIDSIADNGDVSYTDPRSGFRGTIPASTLTKDAKSGAAFEKMQTPAAPVDQKPVSGRAPGGPRYNRVKKLLGAEEGDIVTPQEDIGYTSAGGQYRIDQIEKNGIVHLTNIETGSGTTVNLGELERAKSRKSGFNRVESVAETAPAAQEKQPEITEPSFTRRAGPDGDRSHVARAFVKVGEKYLPVQGVGSTRDEALAELRSHAEDTIERVPETAKAEPKPAETAINQPESASEQAKTAENAPKTEYGANNKLVSQDRAAELRKKLKAKFSQLNSGLDPEILAIGTELAVFHLEAGVRKFADFARTMATDLDVPLNRLRPYLRSWYNGGRDMMEDSGISIEGMDSPETVRTELAKLDTNEQQQQPAAKQTSALDDMVAQFDSEVTPNESQPLGEPGEGSLETAPADAIRAAESEEPAGQRSPRSSGEDVSGSERAGGSGLQRARSVRDDAGEVPVSAGRGEPAGQRNQSGSSQDAGRNADREQPVRGQRPAAGTVAEDRPARAFNIDADEIGKGGKKTKYRNNVAAILLLKDLERMNRQATQEEQAILAKYVGWGGIPEAFKRTDGSATSGWAREVAELDDILQPEEYQAAASSTKNAHYTSPEIVSGMWQAMQRLGFTGGRVLEPSVGVGNFFGLMPSDMRAASALHGVELDRITSGIATQLYPEAKIARMGYQDYVIPNGYFDIAIGNPPFGADKLYDGRRKDLSGFSIHNYFFARTVDALRPGGVMAMVVTNRFMDGASDKARQYIADRADLLGAIRLPNDAFAKNAGTQVTTDIIFLRKRLPDETPSAMNSSWLETVDFTDKNGKVVPLNKYFVTHPENMLGEFGAFGSMYREGDSALIAREGQNTSQLLGEAIQRLPENVIKPVETVKPESRASVAAENARVGSVFLDGNNVMMRDSDELGETRATAVSFPNEKAKARVVGMIGVRDELAALRKLQLDPKADDAAIESARKRLNRAYDAFVKEHGYLNQDANKRLLRDDPTWPQLAALEDDFDKGLSATVAKKTGEEARPASAKKAAIFSRRTQSPYTAPTSAATAKDALVTSLAEKGRVDMELMANLYGKEESQIIRELDDLIYSDPEKGWVTREEYLSGNVKTKLARARERAKTDAAFNRNVEALEAVQPKDIEAVDINVKPGATWLPADTMGAFADMIAETSGAKAFYNPVSAKWSFPGLASSAAAQTRYGTDRADVRTILEAAASQKAIQIFDNHRDGTRTLNETETQLANDKVNAVKEAFGRWIWSDDARRQSLARIYNDQFNTDVPREYDGSHLTFPGKISDDIIRLRPHQANAVWRIVQGGTTLADHVVGAGKTFTLIAAAMELRRMGLARKPLFAVPNHLVGQWATDFVKLYPGAKVLAATKRDFEKENRKKLFARISTGDWDAVIVAHSSFGKAQVDPEHEAEFIREQIDDLTSSIEAIREAEGQSSRNVKDAAKRRDALEERLKKLVDSENKDNSLYWSELGVDALFVDEAHEFKNLAYSTSMRNVAGLGDASGSQRAMDMFMKVRHVLKATGGRNVVFATGTPISNTMAEMYTMQRYMDYDNLKAQGLSHFDAWARMFGEVVTDWELSPSGKYKMTARFAKFVNMPELMQRYTSFADVINRDDINRQLAAQGKKLPVPKMKGGKPTNIVVPRSSMQATYIGEPITDNNGIEQYPQGSLVYRAEHLPKKAEKGADNMLKIMSDARKVALDMRLIEPGAPDFERSKTNEAARRIKEDYDKWADDRGAQLVFIDLSTPKNAKAAEAARIRDLVEKAEQGDEAAAEQLDKLSPDELAALDGEFSVYDDLKQKLVALGIPENEIAFIHDAKTELQKEELFGKVRSGRVRVLLGSTSKMGAGMNVQDRLVALHHLDAPWRPSDLEQREGRIIRQGNKLYDRDPEGFEVGVYRYATKQTLDSRMWQTLEAKARFIEQVRKGNTAQREVEDIGGEAANAAEMKAASSGNPLILEEMTLRQKMRRLENERAGFDRDQYRIRDTIQQQRRKAEWMAKSLDELRQDVNLSVPDKFAMTINGQELEKRKDAGEALLSIAADMEHNHSDERQVGQYGDFPMSMERTSAELFTINLEGAGSYTVNFGIGDDPLGLTMRISNAVKDLGDAITVMEQGREKALAEIPKLQEQLAEWPKAQELKDTRKRHAEVVDQLKPKKAENVAGPATQEQKPQYSVSANRAVRGALARGDAGALVAKLQKDGRIVIHDTPPENRRADAAGWVDPDGSIHLALSNLTAETAQPVLMHELFHSGMNAISGSPRWNNLISRLNEYVEAASRREGRETAWDRAYTRIEQSEEGSRRAEELGAYAVEHFEQMPPGIRKWAETVIGTVKNWVQQRFGVQLGDVTPSQLRALAAGAVRNQSPVKGSTDTAYSMKPGEAKKEAEAFYGKKIDATRDLTGDALTAAMPTLLHWTPGRFLLKRVAKDIPALGEYADIKLKMDTFRDEWHALTDKLAQRWQKYRAKNAAENSQLMQIMHESTLAQADPSEKFESRLNGADLKILRDKKISSDEWQQANKKAMDESAREKEWTRLSAEFQKLSPEGQALYRDVRDLYSKLANTQEAIIVANLEKAMEFRIKEAQREFEDEMQAINDEGLKGEDREKAITAAKKKLDNARRRDAWNRRARVNQLRQEFESNRLAGPYFPLARFGDYFVTARNKKTNEIEVFSRQETPFQQSRVAKELRKQGFEVETGLISKTAELRKQVPAEFVARIEDILKGLPAAKEAQDQVWQLYLERMPDMSLRKNRIHRKGRAGFEEDALRAFASHMFHGAHQTARMKFAMDLQDQLDEAKRQTKYTRNPTRSGLVLEQAEKNHQYVMNPTSNRIAQVATQGAFMWYLAQSPAAALVNMGQTVIVAPSKLAAFYDKGTARGMAVALGQINKAMFDLAKGRTFAEQSRRVTPQEKAAVSEAYRIGLITRTQSHDVAGIADSGIKYRPTRARIMAAMSFMFHHTERINREATFLAAYRIARKRGLDHQNAIRKASELTWDSHYDYQNSSRPAVMHSNTGKALLVFRNYSLNMISDLAYTTYEIINPRNAQERREARTQMIGLLGSLAFNTGIRGLPLFGMLMVIAGMFSDDGEDPEVELKKTLLQYLPPSMVGIMMDGVPGYAFGVELSGRIGFGDLWFRSDDMDREGDSAYLYWLQQLLGPASSIPYTAVRGISQIQDGYTWRGMENLVPKAIRDPMKAYRYYSEGVTTKNGDPIVDEVGGWDVLKQAMGFTPARVTEQYKLNSYNMNKQKAITEERSKLLGDFYKAWKAGDEKKVDQITDKMRAYSEKYPEMRIDGAAVRSSLSRREKYRGQALGGMNYNQKLIPRLQEEQPGKVYR